MGSFITDLKNSFNKGNIYIPVSYTHLDVYKRQLVQVYMQGVIRLQGYCAAVGLFPIAYFDDDVVLI